jgi:hypothetical protein
MLAPTRIPSRLTGLIQKGTNVPCLFLVPEMKMRVAGTHRKGCPVDVDGLGAEPSRWASVHLVSRRSALSRAVQRIDLRPWFFAMTC